MFRLFDVLFSALLLVVLSPWLVYRAIRAYRQTGRVFGKKALLGYGRRSFNRLSFADEVGAGSLAVLFNVFAGGSIRHWAIKHRIKPIGRETVAGQKSPIILVTKRHLQVKKRGSSHLL